MAKLGKIKFGKNKNKVNKDITILEMRKTMDSGGKAKVLDKPTLNLGKTVPFEQIEEIVKTTDSMQIVAKSFKNIEETDAKRLSEASKAILRSYDLAVRKIKATYVDILETKKEIGLEFMTVQILIKQYEQFSDVKQILRVANIFINEIENLLAHGKGIWFSDELVLESADYINKMIPIARIITRDAVIINMMRWEEVADLLVKQSKISSQEKSIIEAMVGAINSNIRNGYFLKLGHLLIARIRPSDPECMVLFSGETIQRMNKIYGQHRNKRKVNTISKSNYLSKFMTNVTFRKQKDKDEKSKIDLEIKKVKQKEAAKLKDITKREAELSNAELKQKLDPQAAADILTKNKTDFEDESPEIKEIKAKVKDEKVAKEVVEKDGETPQAAKNQDKQEIKSEKIDEINNAKELKADVETNDKQETLANDDASKEETPKVETEVVEEKATDETTTSTDNKEAIEANVQEQKPTEKLAPEAKKTQAKSKTKKAKTSNKKKTSKKASKK